MAQQRNPHNSRSLTRPITLMRMPVIGQPAPAYLSRRQPFEDRRTSQRRVYLLMGLLGGSLLLVLMCVVFSLLVMLLR